MDIRSISRSRKLTNQQVAEHVLMHLLDQGKPSFDESGDQCMYRGVEGRTCAVGCLISDADYDRSIEKTSAATAITQLYGPNVARTLEKRGTLEVLSALQTLHDYARFRPQKGIDSETLSRAIESSFMRQSPEVLALLRDALRAVA